MLYGKIGALVEYGVKTGLIEPNASSSRLRV